MTRLFLLLVIAAGLLGAGPLAAQTVAIRDVALVPLDSARAVPGQTVVVRGGVIDAVGASGEVEVPPEATVIDGRGMYLMPGLADMHAHLTHPEAAYYADDNRASLALMLAHGVTTARVMWGSPGLVAFRDSVRRGEILGPSLSLASPFFQGRADSLGAWEAEEAAGDPAILRVGTEADGRAAARYAREAGYDLAKPYDWISPEAYRGLLDEAEALGLPVGGHVPRTVGLARVLLDGRQGTIEHASAFAPLAEAAGSPVRDSSQWYHQYFGRYAHYSPEKLDAIAEVVAASGIWVVPTVLTSEGPSAPRDTMLVRATDPQTVRYTPEAQRALWRGYIDGFATNYARWGVDLGAARGFALALVRALHARGARLLLGTDDTPAMRPHGIAVHREMALWAEAGLPPLAILRAATLDARRYLREAGIAEGTGEIAPGQRADLVLLRADPLADVANAREIEAVVAGGRLLTRADLDAMLASVEALYATTPAPAAPEASGAESP